LVIRGFRLVIHIAFWKYRKRRWGIIKIWGSKDASKPSKKLCRPVIETQSKSLIQKEKKSRIKKINNSYRLHKI
jgi:hypothetical protein